MTIPKQLLEAKICNKDTCEEIRTLKQENQRLNNDIKILLKENEAKEKVIIKYDNILNELKEELEKKNKKYWQSKCAEYHSIIMLFERWLNSEIKRIEKLQNDTKNVKPYGQEFNNYVLIIDTYNYVLNKLEELKEKYTNE